MPDSSSQADNDGRTSLQLGDRRLPRRQCALPCTGRGRHARSNAGIRSRIAEISPKPFSFAFQRPIAYAGSRAYNELHRNSDWRRTVAFVGLAWQRAANFSDIEIDHRYRLLVEADNDYAIFMLDASGHVTSWNLGAQRVLPPTRSSADISRSSIRRKTWLLENWSISAHRGNHGTRTGRRVAHSKGWQPVLGRRYHHRRAQWTTGHFWATPRSRRTSLPGAGYRSWKAPLPPRHWCNTPGRTSKSESPGNSMTTWVSKSLPCK